MAIYTKKGDQGNTSLFDPANSQVRRVSKDSLRIWAIGSVDEVNSFLGICLSLCQDKKLTTKLVRIQRDLFNIGSILSGAKLTFSKAKVNFLETQIDEMEETLPVLRSFILPGGTEFASHLQYVRALTRRAERRIVSLNKLNALNPTILQYINRLSDYFFTLARRVNREAGMGEDTWMKGRR